jgi:putative membrane-bound dehydrogenase-like protein
MKFPRSFSSGILLCVLVSGLTSRGVNAQTATGANENSPGKTPIYNSEREPGQPMSPENSLASIQLPEGFSARLFGAEPDVQNPIAINFDSNGRVWIAENYTYAERPKRFDLGLNDRIIVLEDTDGDGSSDKRTVFCDDLQMLTSLVVGQGGVWVMCPPQVLFIPDRDGDLVPDGIPQVVLDGFTVPRENYHNYANGLSWGPDGWLYGRCGASSPGSLGLPGSPEETRVPMRGGIWRFHPQRKVVEALTAGTTNPWGHDWNEVGELFYINTVNGHLWHAITGAHFIRSHTIEPNPYVYQPMDMHADHWHFDTGKGWTESRNGAANDLGGGHAHIGMMIYQGQSWPASYRGKLMTINMHGRRINMERLDREGSGYVGRHEPDFAIWGDTWFRGLDNITGPDGNVFVIDWYDTGECHDNSGVHRTSGRIYKITYDAGPATESLKSIAGMDAERLAALHGEAPQWHIRMARQQLRTMQVAGMSIDAAIPVLRKQLVNTNAASGTVSEEQSMAIVNRRLEALWTLYTLQSVETALLLALTDDPSEYIRNYALKLLVDSWTLDNVDGTRPREHQEREPLVIERLATLAAQDSSPLVRLTIASALQRLPLEHRTQVARGLLAHAEDAEDHNLPLIVWYGITSLGEKQIHSLAELAKICTWPTTLRLMARRMTERIDDEPELITEVLSSIATGEQPLKQLESVAIGMSQALMGRRKAQSPANWASIKEQLAMSKKEEVIHSLRSLNVLFGDGRQIDELKTMVKDGKLSMDARCAALQSLVDARAEGLRDLCISSLGIRFLNAIAVKGLASDQDPTLGTQILKNFRNFAPLDRPGVLAVVAARAEWAAALLDALESGSLAREEISPYLARQIANHNQAKLTERLAANWGNVRQSSDDKRLQIEALKKQLTMEVISKADRSKGRATFEKSCANCHRLFGEGKQIGPDLTGAQRSNLEYLLENIVDPSSVVTADFRASIVVMEDGRVLTGLITDRNERSLTLATQTELLKLQVSEIQDTRSSNNSVMPDGLLHALTPEQIRDLIGYLQSTSQVEMQ